MSTVTSDTAIANLALQKLGERPIFSLGDDSKAARECNAAFVPTRHRLLRQYAFGFSIVDGQQLALLPDAPVQRYRYAFQLPTNCLQVLNLNQDDGKVHGAPYVIRKGNQLHTDMDVAVISFVADEPVVTRYDSLFVDAFSTALALAVCKSVTGSDEKRSELMREFNALALQEAMAADAREDEPEVPWHLRTVGSGLVRARRTSPLG